MDDNIDIGRMTLAKLRVELKRRDAKTTGKKAQLIERRVLWAIMPDCLKSEKSYYQI